MTEGDIFRIKKIIHLCDDFKFTTYKQYKKIDYGDVYAIKHLYEENKKLQKEIEELKGYISYAPNLDEITAKLDEITAKYEEQQPTEQVIYDVLGEKFILLNEEEIKELLGGKLEPEGKILFKKEEK